MLSLITYKNAPEQIEIIGDSDGIDDLILYLQGIKDARDHMHLIIHSEIEEYPIPEHRKSEVIIIKQVRLEFADTNIWGQNLG